MERMRSSPPQNGTPKNQADPESSGREGRGSYAPAQSVLERFVSDRVLGLGDDATAFRGVVRSLARHGLEVHVAPNDFAAPALKSRFIAAVHRLPPYALGGEAWTSAL